MLYSVCKIFDTSYRGKSCNLKSLQLEELCIFKKVENILLRVYIKIGEEFFQDHLTALHFSMKLTLL